MAARTWLILSVAVLVGTQGPLCAFACLASTGPAEAVIEVSHHGPEEAPCHGTEPVSSRSPDPGQHECCCDELRGVLSKGDGHKALTVVEAPGTLPTLSAVESHPARAPALHLPDEYRNLPPPDILLLKSTLLL